jgi:hypothetical protein
MYTNARFGPHFSCAHLFGEANHEHLNSETENANARFGLHPHSAADGSRRSADPRAQANYRSNQLASKRGNYLNHKLNHQGNQLCEDLVCTTKDSGKSGLTSAIAGELPTSALEKFGNAPPGVWFLCPFWIRSRPDKMGACSTFFRVP